MNLQAVSRTAVVSGQLLNTKYNRIPWTLYSRDPLHVPYIEYYSQFDIREIEQTTTRT